MADIASVNVSVLATHHYFHFVRGKRYSIHIPHVDVIKKTSTQWLLGIHIYMFYVFITIVVLENHAHEIIFHSFKGVAESRKIKEILFFGMNIDMNGWAAYICIYVYLCLRVFIWVWI